MPEKFENPANFILQESEHGIFRLTAELVSGPQEHKGWENIETWPHDCKPKDKDAVVRWVAEYKEALRKLSKKHLNPGGRPVDISHDALKKELQASDEIASDIWTYLNLSKMEIIPGRE